MNGIINVYKEKGYTSHDVIAKLRGICHQKKIGHTGTLDPDAQGVLPVCLGSATKVCGMLTDQDKVYEAVLLLGVETDTQDSSGTILRKAEVTSSEAQIRQVISLFTGSIQQVPPMYSALKVNGKKLCDLAREGIEVERTPRQIQIYQIEILNICLPRVHLRVHCSKGTYIRTLCHDIGQTLGCGGCMEELLRTKVGIFKLQNAVKLAKIQELEADGRLDQILLSPDQLFCTYPKAVVTAAYSKMLANGNRLPRQALVCSPGDEPSTRQKLRVYMQDLFYGIYEWDTRRSDYKPVKIFGHGMPVADQNRTEG
ncbi:MAG: tRNA pseudouridine(55) synthase TruB [Eubacterium sp.]|nr:tRNA pseudouridine(55) synthase TruB [Eubacterium sp.]